MFLRQFVYLFLTAVQTLTDNSITRPLIIGAGGQELESLMKGATLRFYLSSSLSAFPKRKWRADGRKRR